MACGGFSEARPEPPVALLIREIGMAGLGDGAAEDVEDTRVLAACGEEAEVAKELVGVGLREGFRGVDAEGMKVSGGGGSDAAELAEGISGHRGIMAVGRESA